MAHSSSNDDHICGRSYESQSLSKSGKSNALTFTYSNNKIAPISTTPLGIIAFAISSLLMMLPRFYVEKQNEFRTEQRHSALDTLK